MAGSAGCFCGSAGPSLGWSRSSGRGPRASSASARIASSGQARRAGFGIGSTLWLHPQEKVWLWRVEATSALDLPCDAILVQDLGLGPRGSLMNNEAYASQYTDHHVARDGGIGPVVMSRRNLAEGGRHPWAAHGCLDGAASFATDALQLFGPGFRDAAGIALSFGNDLPGERLQHEAACAIIQSRPAELKAGQTASWTFFGLYEPDHPEASSDADLARLDLVRRAAADFRPADVVLRAPARSLVQDAAPVVARSLGEAEVGEAYGERRHEERRDGRLLSFFVPDGPHNRHVVLGDKERLVQRRHGTLLRSGQAMLPDDVTLCATAWMHGVFAAQLTIGNTSFHKLFSVSRDPYNITRASGLRILAEIDGAWRLLAVPSVFEMGLSDCRWVYHLEGRVITVRAIASGEHAAMQWLVDVTGEPCRFLVFGHLVLGERELDHASPVAIDPERKRFSFRPDPNWLWGQRYPDAVYHLVTSTPGEIEAVGGDELHLRRRRGARRRACRDAHAADGRLQLRRGWLDDGCRRGRAPGAAVRRRRRGRRDAGAGGALVVACVARPAARRSGACRSCGDRDGVPVARPQRHDASHRAAWPGAIFRRGLGHARRLPGSDRVFPGARA